MNFDSSLITNEQRSFKRFLSLSFDLDFTVSFKLALRNKWISVNRFSNNRALDGVHAPLERRDNQLGPVT